MAGSPRTNRRNYADHRWSDRNRSGATGNTAASNRDHWTRSVGRDSAIWIGRIVTQKIVPQDGAKVGHAHWGAGVTGFRPLHRIHAQGANGAGQLPARGGGGCPNGGAGSGERRGHRIHHGASGHPLREGMSSLLTVPATKKMKEPGMRGTQTVRLHDPAARVALTGTFTGDH